MKFRKKPVVIDAFQITNELFETNHPNPNHMPGVTYDPIDKHVLINTLEGVMCGKVGDWIIKGVKGEYYPCKPDIFEQTYQEITDVDAYFEEQHKDPEYQKEYDKQVEEENDKQIAEIKELKTYRELGTVPELQKLLVLMTLLQKESAFPMILQNVVNTIQRTEQQITDSIVNKKEEGVIIRP